jgi:DNA-binding LacI/PurR family transcriptional regulator
MVRKDRAPKAPTIYDVARVAEVSHQTVSRYLSGASPLRPASRERVERAIGELGYRPNLSARLLARGESRTVVALTGELLEVGTVQLVEGVRRAARESGYLLDVMTYDSNDPDDLERRLSVLARQDVAGVLALADTDELRDAVERQLLDLFITVAEDAPGTNTVEAQLAIVRHLAALGHRRITYVAGPPSWRSARTRLRAFERAVALEGERLSAGGGSGKSDRLSAGEGSGKSDRLSAGEGSAERDRQGAGDRPTLRLQSDRIDAHDWSAAAGYIAGQIVTDATAVVCANDQIALGVTRALAERGLAVPADVSVVGYDDMPESAYFSPPLTTVRQDFALHGAHAFRRFLQRLEPEVVRDPLPSVEDRLIVRGSTAAPRV